MTPRRRKLPYGEGDVVVVPLRDGGFACGVIARTGRSGITLGYFFGPRLDRVPEAINENEFEPDAALKVCRFGDLQLIQGTWVVLGRLSNWSRPKWLLPQFCRNGEIRVTYDEETLQEIRAEYDPQRCASLPQDGLEGAGYVEIVLTKLLAAQSGTTAGDPVREP